MNNKSNFPWHTEKDFYDLHANEIFKKDTFYHVNMIGDSEEDFTNYIINRLGLEKKHKVVDLGCGSGMLVNRISHVCEAIGISTSSGCINNAKKNYPENNFVLANMENYKEKEVTHFLTLESIGYANVSKTLANVYSNLVDGGIFYIKDTTPISNPNEKERSNINYWEDYWKYYTLDVPSLIEEAYKCGYSLHSFKEISSHPKLNMRPFMETLKNNIVVQEYPYPDIPVHIGTEFIFQKLTRKKWINPYI